MNAKFGSDIEDELDLHVRDEGDATCVDVRLPAPPGVCYALFNDADHLTEWLVAVGTVVIGKRDERNRALEIDFMGSLKRASVSYTLVYEYDDAKREVRWRHKSGSVRRLQGSARFVPETEATCRLEYRLSAELPKELPPWADELYRARPAETVVLDFCEWLNNKLPGE